jgi:PAS domain-containing protein
MEPEPRGTSETGGLYRTMVEQISAITYVDTLDHGTTTPVYVSPQVEALIGVSADEWLADPVMWRSWVRDEAEVVLDDAGRPHLLRGLLYDIDERKQAEETLQRSEELVRKLYSRLLQAQEDEE